MLSEIKNLEKPIVKKLKEKESDGLKLATIKTKVELLITLEQPIINLMKKKKDLKNKYLTIQKNFING